MNPIKPTQASTGQASGSFTMNAMRAIRILQKQAQELGKRYQEELLHPTATGTAQQQLLRNLAQQMNSVDMEIDALQDAIIQHEALAALKREQGNDTLKAAQPMQEGHTPGASETDAAAKPGSPEDTHGPQPERSVSGTVGSVIDTTA